MGLMMMLYIYSSFMKAFDTKISGQWLLALRFYNTPKNLFKWIGEFFNSQKKVWLN